MNIWREYRAIIVAYILFRIYAFGTTADKLALSKCRILGNF